MIRAVVPGDAEPTDLGVTRASYDAVATDYAHLAYLLAGRPGTFSLPAGG